MDSFVTFCVTAHLSSSLGTYGERPVLDSLLAYATLRDRGEHHQLQGGQSPTPWEPGDLPLAIVRRGDLWWWDCTAAMGTIVAMETRSHRKRFDSHHATRHTSSRRANLAAGTLKGIDLPLPTALLATISWYGRGCVGTVERLLRTYVHSLGKRRNTGLGTIREWEIVPTDEGEMVAALLAEFGEHPPRHVPESFRRGENLRWIRLHPPYWHLEDRILCSCPPDWAVGAG